MRLPLRSNFRSVQYDRYLLEDSVRKQVLPGLLLQTLQTMFMPPSLPSLCLDLWDTPTLSSLFET